MTGQPGALYCSREAHYSVVRAAELLGIGCELVRAVPQDAQRRVVPDEVANAIERDLADGVAPIAVVATAGTTLTGAVDPIDALADVCAERDTWLHVDGAYGVAAATTPSAGDLFAGLERADSVTLDAHKWLFLPKACGVVLVRRREDLRGALAHEEDYVPHEAALVRNRGRRIVALPGDTTGLTIGLSVTQDILGRPIVGDPDLGAIELP